MLERTFTDLPPGRYTATFTIPGFTPVRDIGYVVLRYGRGPFGL
jgi:hypothetical protein